MSESLLRNAFDVDGVKHIDTRFEGDTFFFDVEAIVQDVECPECGGRIVTFKGKKTRALRLPPFASKRAWLNVTMQRVRCEHCGKHWWPHLPFMMGKRRITRSFARFAMMLMSHCTIQSTAALTGAGWDMIKDLHKLELAELYSEIPLDEVEVVSIDEISIKKRHVYMTVVTDAETGRILHAVEGRKKEDVTPFLTELAVKAPKLRAIAMDMSSAYFGAAREALPDVDIVFDRFHITALMNRAIDELRRDVQGEMDGLEKKR